MYSRCAPMLILHILLCLSYMHIGRTKAHITSSLMHLFSDQRAWRWLRKKKLVAVVHASNSKTVKLWNSKSINTWHLCCGATFLACFRSSQVSKSAGSHFFNQTSPLVQLVEQGRTRSQISNSQWISDIMLHNLNKSWSFHVISYGTPEVLPDPDSSKATSNEWLCRR